MPYKYQRTLGIVDEFGSLLDCRLVGRGIRYIAAHEIHLCGHPFGLVHLCILREVENDRTRPTSACDIKSTADCPCYILWTSNLVAPFRDRLCHTHEVNLLEGISSKHSHSHLSCYDHDGR